QVLRLRRAERDDLAIEIVMLRHEAVLRRQVGRPLLQPNDRALFAGLSRLLSKDHRGRLFVQPETLLRWHRDMVRRRWSYPHGRSGRPGVPAGTVDIVLRLTGENPTWGYRRSTASSSRWVCVSPFERAGDPSAPRHRSRSEADGPSWSEFLQAQASSMLACDFFHVDTVLLRRFYVLFFIELDTRRVYVTGVTANPVREWVIQQARNLSSVLAERAVAVRFLIRDRDAKFTASFDEVFRSEGIRIICTPVRAPRANAFAERFVGTVRRECLDRMLVFSRHQ